MSDETRGTWVQVLLAFLTAQLHSIAIEMVAHAGQGGDAGAERQAEVVLREVFLECLSREWEAEDAPATDSVH